MIRRLIASYRLLKRVDSYYDIADSADFWNGTNADVTQSFFAQETGQKLKLRLRNMVFSAATQACDKQKNGDYARGIARGILLAVHAIEKHLPPSSAYDEPSEVELEEQASF